MQLDLAMLKKLDLSTAAGGVTGGQLDRFPPLLMDRCVGGPTSPLVPAVVNDFTAGTSVQGETLSMPRKGFSPRPVTVMSPGARTLYCALIDKLSPSLASERSPEARDTFSKLAVPRASGDSIAHEYLVEFDIASCYEYVEHPRLREELVLRTMDLPHVEAVMALLSDLYPKARGLPQLNAASDRLADTYLEILERSLLRTNTHVARFADDFKVEVPSWNHATQVLEDAAEHARGLGLILSADKTHVTRSATLLARMQETQAFLAEYFVEAESALTSSDFFWQGGYGTEVVEVPPGQEETVREAMRRVFEDWVSNARNPAHAHVSQHATVLPAALNVLKSADARLPDSWLAELVLLMPIRLEAVSNYLLARLEPRKNWTTLKLLSSMGRQGPWAKLWLLHVAASQPAVETTDENDFHAWAARQLGDRHEVVRSEAAWYLALKAQDLLPEARLAGLYSEASSLTRPSLAAACGAHAVASSSGLGKAVKQDTKLTSAAYEYGASAV